MHIQPAYIAECLRVVRLPHCDPSTSFSRNFTTNAFRACDTQISNAGLTTISIDSSDATSTFSVLFAAQQGRPRQKKRPRLAFGCGRGLETLTCSSQSSVCSPRAARQLRRLQNTSPVVVKSVDLVCFRLRRIRILDNERRFYLI
jgi:hypothetical protein